MVFGSSLILLALVLFAYTTLRSRRGHRFIGRKAQAGLAVIMALGIAVAGMGAAAYLSWAAYANSSSFSYRAVLEPAGQGRAVVSLPMPVPTDQAFVNAVRVTPASAVVSLNTSGEEPSLDVEISEMTWVNVTLRNADPGWRVYRQNLTRTEDFSDECSLYRNCSSEMSLRILQGVVASAEVRLEVEWSWACNALWWRLEARVAPGVGLYEGQWSAIAC